MVYSHEVEHMCVVKKGPNFGLDSWYRLVCSSTGCM